MTDRKPLISGNWKMHHNHFEALQLVQKLSYLLTKADYDEVDVSVHPPFTDLRTVQTYFISEKEPIPIALGAQNCHTEEKGAFTGEVAAPMLAKLDAVAGRVGEERLAPGAREGALDRFARGRIEAAPRIVNALHHPESVRDGEALEVDAAQRGRMHADAARDLSRLAAVRVGPHLDRTRGVEDERHRVRADEGQQRTHARRELVVGQPVAEAVRVAAKERAHG